jgi:two-component system chemotaxis response regulator CheB
MTASGALQRVHEAKIDVLVVDDSAVVRGMIAKFAQTDPNVRVVGEAGDGEAALDFLSLHPVDIVLLDIDMPRMDGLTALPEILRLQPNARVVIVSTYTSQHAEMTLRALELGAADCIEKPLAARGPDGTAEFRRELVSKIGALVRPIASLGGEAPQDGASEMLRTPDVIAFGSSTGGPPALMRIFGALRGTIRQPIFITQHMPATFTDLLADQLARASGGVVAPAVDGERIIGHRTYLAPGGAHLTVVRRDGEVFVKLSDAPPENFCRPAVDPMLRSLAHVYGGGVLAFILTGMGADGGAGCKAVANAGGRFVVQDRDSSVVWGMPAAAAKDGLAEAVLPLSEIAPWLRRAARAE